MVSIRRGIYFIKDIYLESLPPNIKTFYLDLSLQFFMSKKDEFKNIKLFLVSIKQKLGLAGNLLMPRLIKDSAILIRTSRTTDNGIIQI